mmetsp:Transcript_15638/g.28425  ORF Transcript_15638/g.28425 Transcript_15638/m.28425 type:complete len:251 (+) Transcript_15638:3-755(+)
MIECDRARANPAPAKRVVMFTGKNSFSTFLAKLLKVDGPHHFQTVLTALFKSLSRTGQAVVILVDNFLDGSMTPADEQALKILFQMAADNGGHAVVALVQSFEQAAHLGSLNGKRSRMSDAQAGHVLGSLVRQMSTSAEAYRWDKNLAIQLARIAVQEFLNRVKKKYDLTDEVITSWKTQHFTEDSMTRTLAPLEEKETGFLPFRVASGFDQWARATWRRTSGETTLVMATANIAQPDPGTSSAERGGVV